MHWTPEQSNCQPACLAACRLIDRSRDDEQVAKLRAQGLQMANVEVRGKCKTLEHECARAYRFPEGNLIFSYVHETLSREEADSTHATWGPMPNSGSDEVG